MNKNKKAIIIFSGGLDSTTLLYYLLNKEYELEAISYDYGQKHKKELDCAKEICKDLNIKHNIIDISFIGKHINSSLTQDDQEIPEGHYESENMESTVVYHRNLMMMTIANAIGLSRGILDIAYAAHAGDHIIYPDCRPMFADSAEITLKISSDKKINIIRPFINIDKTDILRIGLNLNVPYEKTWSCYKGNKLSCGKCGTCIERLEAFKKCNIKDPIEYENKV